MARLEEITSMLDRSLLTWYSGRVMEDGSKESFGERFDRLRLERGLNRSEFARLALEKTGKRIEPSTQKNWSRERSRSPLRPTIQRVAATLGVSVNDLLWDLDEVSRVESAEWRRKRASDEDAGEITGENG